MRIFPIIGRFLEHRNVFPSNVKPYPPGINRKSYSSPNITAISMQDQLNVIKKRGKLLCFKTIHVSSLDRLRLSG